MDEQTPAQACTTEPPQGQEAVSEQAKQARLRQLQPEERVRLASLKQQGLGVRKIAQKLRRYWLSQQIPQPLRARA